MIQASQASIREHIPFTKPAITVRELKSVLDCIFQGEITSGKVVKNFERECSNYFNLKYSLAVSSPHAAYHLAFLGLGLQQDDEVILSSLSPLAALDALGYIQANPVVVDVEKGNLQPSVETILEHITEKTKVILLDYRFGAYKNFQDLKREISKQTNFQHKIHTIANISENPQIPHYINTTENKDSVADIYLLSYEFNMPVTMGKGAVLMTNVPSAYEKIKDMRNPHYGAQYRVRFDYCITDYQAAMGMEQLANLEFLIKRRKKMGHLYLDNFQNSSLQTYFKHPEFDTYAFFPVTSSCEPKNLISLLKKKNIETRRILSHAPIHHLLELPKDKYLNTEKLFQTGILLPIYPHLSNKNIVQISQVVRQAVLTSSTN